MDDNSYLRECMAQILDNQQQVSFINLIEESGSDNFSAQENEH